MPYVSKYKGSQVDEAIGKAMTALQEHQSLEGYAKTADLATVATTGSYNDLTDKPDIPSGGADITVDESLSATSTNPVQNKAITTELNKKGTYSKPSTGIPKSDLANDVQESLGKADTALQSFEERYKGTVTSVKINGSTKNPDADGLVDLGNIEGGEGGSVIVDEALSDTSTNPVQNKAITKALQSRLQSFWTPNPGYDANVLQRNSFVSFTYANGAPVPGVLADFSTGYYGVQLNTYYFSDGPLYYRRHAQPGDGGIGLWQQIARVNENKLTPSLGTLTIDGAIKANDYLDAYGISLYETFATKTELDIPVVNQESTTVTIEPNTLNRWGVVDSLNVSFSDPTDGVVNEYLIEFRTGENPPRIVLPETIKWATGTPVIGSNAIYQISIIDNLALLAEYV